MRKVLFFFTIALLAIVSCSLPGSNLKGSRSSSKDAVRADNKILGYTEEDFKFYVKNVSYDFTQPGTYTWKNSFQDATVMVIIIGGGGGGGGSASWDRDPLEFENDNRGVGGAGGGAGQVVEIFPSLAYLEDYTVVVGSGGARGRRGSYESHGYTGGDGTYSRFSTIRADFGRGGKGGPTGSIIYSEGGFGYPAGEDGFIENGMGGIGGNNGYGHGHEGAPAANGNDGHPAPANSGGGGGGASGAQFRYKGNYGGAGGSGRVTITVSGFVKAYRIQNRWTGEYLYEKLDPATGASLGVAAGYVPSAMRASLWMEEYVAEFSTIRLKNMATGHYMHIEDETLPYVGCSAVPPGWYSAQWYLDEVDGYKRFRNLWKGTVIHVENHTNMSEIASLSSGYLSSQWNLVPVKIEKFYFAWKNRFSGAYMYDAPDGTQNCDYALMNYFIDAIPESAQWFFGETGGFLIPVNRATNDSLNIEVRDGQARMTDVPPNYFSSHWALEESDGYVRFKNRWTGEYLYQDASGFAKYAAEPPSLESSHWIPIKMEQ